jgi:hypothetical protein
MRVSVWSGTFAEKWLAAICDFASKWSRAALTGGILNGASTAIAGTTIRNRRMAATLASQTD